SPVAGRVLQVNIRAGEFAPASVPIEGLVVIGRGGPVHLRVEIDEVDIARFSPGSRAWASPRGDAGQRIGLQLAYVEPLVVPKANLSGRTSERVDTRVLQAVYEIDAGTAAASSIGQQFDVYIEASGGTP
ncbi:MAG: HlyD family efflux transporter periplasmic adaptor subunit, partial [Planctomycetota bacterium]